MDVRIGVGNDPQSWLAGEVLKSSIRRRTERDVVFVDSWSRDGGWHPLLKSGPNLPMGTPFSAWRWHVPGAFGWSGRALYLDSDQVVLGDIGELFDWPIGDDQLFAAVVGASGDILGKGKPHPDAVQSSVMCMDCARCDWNVRDLFGQVMAGKLEALPGRSVDPHFAEHRDPRRVAYGNLQQANWIPLEKIARLDPVWNSLNLYEEGRTKLLHYTVSREQPWRVGDRDDITARIWFDELEQAVLDGHVSRDDVAREVAAGHVHKRVLGAVSYRGAV